MEVCDAVVTLHCLMWTLEVEITWGFHSFWPFYVSFYNYMNWAMELGCTSKALDFAQGSFSCRGTSSREQVGEGCQLSALPEPGVGWGNSIIPEGEPVWCMTAFLTSLFINLHVQNCKNHFDWSLSFIIILTINQGSISVIFLLGYNFYFLPPIPTLLIRNSPYLLHLKCLLSSTFKIYCKI